jgi:hypothetical protein
MGDQQDQPLFETQMLADEHNFAGHFEQVRRAHVRSAAVAVHNAIDGCARSQTAR